MGYITFFVSALSIIMGNKQADSNAKAQFEYNKRVQQESIKNAAAFASSSYGALQSRSRQISNALAVEQSNVTREARKASATEAVSQGELGVQGATAGDIQQSFTSTLSEYMGILETQEFHEQAQVERQKESTRVQQINSIYIGDTVQRPSAWVAFANINSAFASSWAASGGDMGGFGG